MSHQILFNKRAKLIISIIFKQFLSKIKQKFRKILSYLQFVRSHLKISCNKGGFTRPIFHQVVHSHARRIHRCAVGTHCVSHSVHGRHCATHSVHAAHFTSSGHSFTSFQARTIIFLS